MAVGKQLTEQERKTFNQMKAKIQRCKKRNTVRENFIEADKKRRSLGIDIPESMGQFQTMLNWPKKAVTAFAARQIPTGFDTPVPTSLLDDLDAVYEDNGYQAEERQVIESADEMGVSFVFSTRGDVSAGEPVVLLTTKTALTATAVLDPRSRQVAAALETVDNELSNYYLPGRILTVREQGPRRIIEHETATPSRRVMCAPHVHGGALRKRLGRSRVTQPLMDLTMAGMRTMLRQDVSAQFYMAPRFGLLGADESVFYDADGRKRSAWEALIGGIWAIPDIHEKDDTDVPDALRRAGIHNFQQLSMQPFSDQFRLLAAAVSGETSIPAAYLGVVQDSNPTSAASVEAHEVDLIREVNAQNPILGQGRRTLALNVLELLHGGLDPQAYQELRGLTPRWEDPRTRSMAEVSQMVAQQTQIGNLQPATKTTVGLLPISAADADAAVEEGKRAAGGTILDRALSAADPGPDAVDDPTPEGTSRREQADTFGVMIRAGATPETAAQFAAGDIPLTAVQMVPGAMPNSYRVPQDE